MLELNSLSLPQGVGVVLVTIVTLWWIITALTGILLGFFNPINQRVHHCFVNRPRWSLTIGSVGVRINLWDLKERIVVDIKGLDMRMSDPREAPLAATAKPVGQAPAALALFSVKSAFLLNFLLRKFPSLRVVVKNVSVTVGALPKVTVHEVEFFLPARFTVKDNWKASLTVTLLDLKWNKLHVKTLRVETAGLIHQTTGVVSRIKLRASVLGLTASLSRIVEELADTGVSEVTPSASADLREHSKPKLKRETLINRARWLELAERSVAELTVNLNNIHINDIPLLSEMTSIQQLSFSHQTVLQVRVQTATLTYRPHGALSPGFDLHFRPSERAFQVDASISLLEVHLWSLGRGKGHVQIPLLSAPHAAMTVQTNAASQLVEIWTTGCDWSGCTVVGSAVAGGAIVDLRAETMAVVVLNAVLLGELSRYQSANPNESQPITDEGVIRGHPQLYLKVSLDGPTVVVKAHTDTLRLSRLALALAVFAVESEGASYNITTNLLDLSLSYHEPDALNAALVHLHTTTARISLSDIATPLCPPEVEVSGARVNLSDVIALRGAARLITDIASALEAARKLDTFSIPGELLELAPPAVSLFFDPLPALLACTLRANKIVVEVGAISVVESGEVPLGKVLLLLSEITVSAVKGTASQPWSVSVCLLKLCLEAAFGDPPTKPCLWIPKAELCFKAHNLESHRRLGIAIMVGRVEGHCGIESAFAGVGALSILQEVGKALKSAIGHLSVGRARRPNPAEVWVTMDLKETDLIVALPRNLQMRFQVAGVGVDAPKEGPIMASVKLFRILLESPTVHGFWTRLACVEDCSVVAHTATIPAKVEVQSSAVRLVSPHQFRLYQLFELLALGAKTMELLVAALQGNMERATRPQAEPPLVLPDITLHAKRVSYATEDDAFESEMNALFQLGALENAQRMEKMREFELREGASESMHTVLLQHFSTSWVHRVRDFRALTVDEARRNALRLYGGEGQLGALFTHQVLKPSLHAPLLLVEVMGLEARIGTPLFDNLEAFLAEMGQGLPAMPWTVMVPMGIQVSALEVRAHIRDYPLPLAWIPRGSKGLPALVLSGDAAIAEAFYEEDSNVREVSVPLTRAGEAAARAGRLASAHVTVSRTVAPIWLFGDLSATVNTLRPTTATWGVSYRAALDQLLQAFDHLVKPPIDPSPPVGIWDKVRANLHGRFTLKVENALHVNLKGSRDPYALLGTAGGFTLGFDQHVKVTVNPTDDPADFLGVEAGEVSWSVPNHLALPLLVWGRALGKAVAMVNSQKFINTTYGYQNLTDAVIDSRSSKTSALSTGAKTCVSLTGGITFGLGFMFERENRTFESIAFYDLRLATPASVEKGHDSFAGFRSEFVHMAISVSANNPQSRNAISLSPGLLSQFMDWWHLFAGNMDTPVRSGVLFGKPQVSLPLSEKLATLKFQFRVSPLTILVMDHQPNPAGGSACVGLKGRVGGFTIDLHQRKEPTVERHEVLGRENKVMKMVLNVGLVDVREVDVRMVDAVFQGMGQPTTAMENPADNAPSGPEIDSTWVDDEDFEEFLWPSVRGKTRLVLVQPLMFVPRFTYERYVKPRSHSSSPFGNEPLHECLITNHTSEPTVENQFTFEDVLLKWNNGTRNLLLKFIHYVGLRSSLMRFFGHDAVMEMERVVREKVDSPAGVLENEGEGMPFDLEPATSGSSLGLVSSAETFNGAEEAQAGSFCFTLLSPQIQLTSDATPNYSVNLITPRITISVTEASGNTSSQTIKALLVDATIYLLPLDTTHTLYRKHGYGSENHWPPFLTLEIFDDTSIHAKHLLVERTSIEVCFEVGSHLEVNIPALVLACTSPQYVALHLLVSDLLIYAEPMSEELDNRLEKLALAIDLNNLSALPSKIRLMVFSFQSLTRMANSYNFRQHTLDNAQLNDYATICTEQTNLAAEMYLLMSAVCRAGSAVDGTETLKWSINADLVVLHMLNDNHSPFVDLAIARALFSRVEHANGSNQNHLSVGVMEAVDRTEGTHYPDLLRPFVDTAEEAVETPRSMIEVDWDLGQTVGGITVVQDFVIRAQPLGVAVEQAIGDQLVRYLFPPHEGDNSDNSDESDSELDELLLSIKKPMGVDGESAPESRAASDYKNLSLLGDSSAPLLEEEILGEQATEMMKRASTYMSIVRLKVHPLTLKLSYNGVSGLKRAINVHGLVLRLPEFGFTDKIWCMEDITLALQKYVVKALLSQTGRILGNQMTHHKRSREIIAKIKPLADYVGLNRSDEGNRVTASQESEGKFEEEARVEDKAEAV